VTLRYRLEADLERLLRQREEASQGRCDACGASTAVLIREEVEGIVSERCPECRAQGAVP